MGGPSVEWADVSQRREGWVLVVIGGETGDVFALSRVCGRCGRIDHRKDRVDTAKHDGDSEHGDDK